MKKKWTWMIVGVFMGLLVGALAFAGIVQAAPEGAPLLAPIGTAFTYQGYITDTGNPANGSYNLAFKLYDDASGGIQVGSTVTKNAVPVSDGYFTIELDFGDVFDGTALWLAIEVQGPGDPGFTALSPRQELTGVPYAHYARNIPLSGSGSSSAAAHSDHDHWGASWSGSGDGFSLTSSDQSALVGMSSTGGNAGVVGITDFPPGYWAWPPPAGVYGEVTTPGSSAVAVAGMAPYSAISGRTTEGGTAVSGYAPDGTGVYGNGMNAGVEGESDHEFGKGVYGYAISATGQNIGVYGLTDSSEGTAGVFWNKGDSYNQFGAALKTINFAGAGTAIVSQAWTETSPDNWDVEEIFRVDNDGDVYADRAYHCGLGTGSEPGTCIIQNSQADFAEMLPSATDLEAGDVLMITPEGRLEKAASAYQSSVVGVYSTQPGYLGGGEYLGETGYAPLAIVGVVPVKASSENGAIQPGDLLVSASIPGYAMKAGANPPLGTVIGKALAPLAEGTGVIQMLVTLQ